MRERLVEKLAERILNIGPKRLRIGIDGVDAAGKTSLADELVPYIARSGRQVLRASIDGFHNPRVARYQRGKRSPEGYYRDSFDLAGLQHYLLQPLAPKANGVFQTAIFDYRVDRVVEPPVQIAAHDAVLLFDGVFLGRPELVRCWDLRIFLKVSFEEVIRRAVTRDISMDSAEDIISIYKERYIPGQMIYFVEARPCEFADVVIDNNNYQNPLFLRI